MKMYKIFKIKGPVWYLVNETNIYRFYFFFSCIYRNMKLHSLINMHSLISTILVMLFILSKALTNF